MGGGVERRRTGPYIEYCAKFKKTTACKPWNGHDDLGMANNNDFPSSIKGKGFDTALVCSWVSVFLESQDKGCQNS